MNAQTQGLRRPQVPIRTPQKMTLAILCLIFGALFAFVFKEEHQRGIALIIAIPFALCLVYFLYLWLKDHEALQNYKRYRASLLEKVRKEESKYELKKEQTFDPSTAKDFIGVIAILDLIAIIALIGVAENKGLVLLTAIVFVILIVIYAWMDNYDSQEVEKETNELEEKVSSLRTKSKEENTTE